MRLAELLDALLIKHGLHGVDYVTTWKHDVPYWPMRFIKERIGEPAEILIDKTGQVTLVYPVDEGFVRIVGELGEGDVIERATAAFHFS